LRIILVCFTCNHPRCTSAIGNTIPRREAYSQCLNLYCSQHDPTPLGGTSCGNLKDSLFALHTKCCKSRGFHGESNMFVNLLCSCIEMEGGSILKFLAEECCPEDLKSTAAVVNLYDIILGSGSLGNNHLVLTIFSKVQPDITTLTSGLVVCWRGKRRAVVVDGVHTPLCESKCLLRDGDLVSSCHLWYEFPPTC
jgi:hypothetical protein